MNELIDEKKPELEEEEPTRLEYKIGDPSYEIFPRITFETAIGYPDQVKFSNNAGTASMVYVPGGTVQNTGRSEEHTSELQSRENLVCRLLLEKKNERKIKH